MAQTMLTVLTQNSRPSGGKEIALASRELDYNRSMAIWPRALRKAIDECRSRRHRCADCCQILMRTTMQIRPIRTSKNHRAALAEIEKLWGPSTGTSEGDKLDILVTLVETYEERRWPLRSRRRFDPVDVLRYAIEELGHSQAELADILGSRSRASEVLARRRPLTLEMIQKINTSWKIPADLLVQPYRIDVTAA
jgi:HTH-type transcriptional regulator / antitoxin HigA